MATAQISPDYNAFYTPGSLPPDPGNAPKPRVNSLVSSKGLFEGGKFSENTHTVVQAGLRLEQHLGATNKRLFVEMSGQALASNSQLGPLDDSFSGVGLRAGILASL